MKETVSVCFFSEHSVEQVIKSNGCSCLLHNIKCMSYTAAVCTVQQPVQVASCVNATHSNTPTTSHLQGIDTINWL